jgi:hypothetical protein
MTFCCTAIIGLIVFVALMFVSLPALVIVTIGTVLIWLLSRPGKSDGSEHGDSCHTEVHKELEQRTAPDDDAMSVDSGIWSAQDFATGAVKDASNRPHRQPPSPPTGEVSAFRTIAAPAGADPNDALYENHLDSGIYAERMNRGHEGNLRHFYVNGLNNAMKVARKELPMKDPNLLPIDPQAPIGCPRPLGKI